MPLIIGTARDEGTLHTMAYRTVSPDELAWFVRTTFGAGAVAPVIARPPVLDQAIDAEESAGR